MPFPRVCLIVITGLCLFGCGLALSNSSESSSPKTQSAEPKPVEPPKSLSVSQQKDILITETKLQHVDSMMIFYASLDNDDKFPAATGQKLLERLTKKHDLQNDGYFADPVFENKDAHLDAWGRPFHYEWPNTKAKTSKKPAIWSYGPNGTNENGNGDDIRNW